MKMLKGKKCGVCKAPATHSCRDAFEEKVDLSEKQVEALKRGEEVIQQERFRVGEMKFGCDDHPVKSKTHYLDGSVE